MGRVSDAKEKLMSAVTELIWIGSYGSTTIDQICDRAGVKKGSFYYFFASKAALAEVAMREGWQVYRSKFDQMFSASLPPLERLHVYCESEFQEQLELKQKFGFALGCPLCTLGSEISTLEANLRATVEEIMQQVQRYFETTVRDAQAAGLPVAGDPKMKAQTIYAFVEGVLTQARIHDDVDLLRGLESGILGILGLSTHQPQAA